MLESYRSLVRLWSVILSFSALGVITLQVLGPPSTSHDGPRQIAPQPVTPPPSPPLHADQVAAPPAPMAPAPPAAAAATEQPAFAASAQATPAQPTRRRARSWVRRGAWPTRLPADFDANDDSALAERGLSEPLPQDRGALPLPAAPSPPRPAPAYQHVAGGYIGIFTTDPDGRRVFRATP